MSVMVKESPVSEQEMIAEAEKALADISRVREGVGRIIFGQESVVERALVALLAGGHALLVGVPGLAKTKLVETLGIVLGLDTSRIQFTPDLMPSDILGSEVMEQDDGGRRSFRFIAGPIFAQLLMADEINRASPRTQSALLQAMQEYHVTVAGQRYDLPAPFHVLATQNPLEQEGTYPLPEAQLDRFLMQIDILYPELEAERRILIETTGIEDAKAENVIGPERLKQIQTLIRRMPVPESVVEAILRLVRSARPGQDNAETDKLVAWGPGPRASQALMLCTRARALYDGRLAPST
ncbi:MAG: MoxR family ATPase, partial [Mesorhizobium sp.]